MSRALETLTTDQQATFRALIGVEDGPPGSAGGGVVLVSAHYEDDDGANLRPAFQRAIDAAVADGGPRKVVNDYGAEEIELWDKAGATGSLVNLFTEKLLTIPECDGLEIDFNGAQITLKNPGGSARTGQTVTDIGFGSTFYGGFLTVTGDVGYLRIANVTVDGGVISEADALAGTGVSLYDKGFCAQDLTIGKLILDNVSLRRFHAEIFYDNSSEILVSSNCTFDTSPQSCWNPNGNGRAFVSNLRAGVSRQPAEVVGGSGHTYVGGLIYNGGAGGCTYVGGPDGAFGDPYNVAVRRTDAAPPYIEFIGTRFENVGNAVYLGCWVRGSIICTDSSVVLSNAFAVSGHIHDVDLEIITTADRCGNNIVPVLVDGPASFDGSQFTNINLRVRAGRTDYGQGAGSSSFSNALQVQGAVAPGSCSFRVEGTAQKAWRGYPTTSQPLPRIEDSGFSAYSPEVMQIESGFPWTVTSPLVLLLGNSASDNTTYTASLDTTHSFSDGQRVRFDYATSHGGGTRVVFFPKDGTGLRLRGNRFLRLPGHHLDLEYSASASCWVEAGFNGDDGRTSTQTGTSYTAVLADGDGTVRFTNGSAVSFTIPPNSSVAFPVGTVIRGIQGGAGALSFVAGGGVTLNGADLTAAGQYASIYVEKVATDTWDVGGAL